jgi:hypothetical protein
MINNNTDTVRSDILASHGKILVEASENEGLAGQQMSQNWDGMEIWNGTKSRGSVHNILHTTISLHITN